MHAAGMHETEAVCTGIPVTLAAIKKTAESE
jgi:hypothetical protein